MRDAWPWSSATSSTVSFRPFLPSKAKPEGPTSQAKSRGLSSGRTYSANREDTCPTAGPSEPYQVAPSGQSPQRDGAAFPGFRGAGADPHDGFGGSPGGGLAGSYAMVGFLAGDGPGRAVSAAEMARRGPAGHCRAARL